MNSSVSISVQLNHSETIPAWITYHLGLTIWYGIMWLLIITGALLNSFLFVAILTHKKLRHGSGLLISHFLVLNFLQCCIFMPMMAISTFHGSSYQFGPPEFCRYLILFYFADIWTINWASFLVAINRIVAIFFPHKYKYWADHRTVIGMIIISWIIPLTCGLVMFYGIGGRFIPTKPFGACGIIPDSTVVVVPVNAVCVYFPIATTTALYLGIFIVFWMKALLHRRQIADRTTDERANGENVIKKRFSIAKMLFMSSVWYSVTLLPAPIASGSYPKQYNSIPVLQLFLRALLFCAGRRR